MEVEGAVRVASELRGQRSTMRVRYLTVDRTRLLSIVTPRRREAERDIEEFFGMCTRELVGLDLVVMYVGRIIITLHSSEGLSPEYLAALSNFLREQPFTDTGACAFELWVRLASDGNNDEGVELGDNEENDDDDEDDDEDEDDDDDDQGVVLLRRPDAATQDATDRISQSFWENNCVRRVLLQSPVVPNSTVLDRMCDFDEGNDDCPVVWVHDESPERFPVSPDSLQFAWYRGPWNGGIDVMAEGPENMEKMARYLVQWPRLQGFSLHVGMYSVSAVGVFVRALNSFRNHSFPDFAFRYIGYLSKSEGIPEGSGICGAALRCPSVENLKFEGFMFSFSALNAAQGAHESGPSAALKKLDLDGCSFPDPDFGPIELATAMSTNNKLEEFCLSNPILRGIDITASLCTALTDSNWDLERLILSFDSSLLKDDQVEHFFRNLPVMTTLRYLKYGCVVPESLCNIVVDGFKYNYWLRDLEEVCFAGDPGLAERLNGQIAAYVRANRSGRTTIHQSASSPNDSQLEEEAIEVLSRLSRSDDLEDTTSLFLCLQLFLPSRPPFGAHATRAGERQGRRETRGSTLLRFYRLCVRVVSGEGWPRKHAGRFRR